jgi:rubrerythrin
MFKNASSYGKKIAIAAIPVAMAGMFKKAYGGTKESVTEVLNFALTLEYLEDEFYKGGLAASGLIPADRRTIFTQIGKHETSHVAFLKSTITSLSATPVAKPTFDFTAGGAFADVFTNYQTFLAVSQAFEDTGVRAYKGRAAELISNDTVLTAALQIHSVEARHASLVRRLRAEKGWISGDSRGTLPAATQGVYDGEDNVTQGGVNVTTLGYNATISSQAFDEPLTPEAVLAIAGLFIV